MNPQVEKYLADYETKKHEEREKMKKKLLIDLGLYTLGKIEVTKSEYKETLYYENPTIQKDMNGKLHYYKQARIPLEVTDEEYAAILSTIPKERNDATKNDKGKDDSENKYVETVHSFAASFFTFITWLLWIVGLIISYQAEKRFDFLHFLSSYAVYFISGCVSLCFAELFKKLQAILNALNKTHDMMSKWD